MRRKTRVRAWVEGTLWVLPAFAFYGTFVLYPIATAIQYSLYDWNGIGAATYVGAENYREVFTDPDRLSALKHAFILILFFSAIPVGVGLVLAVLLNGLRSIRARGAAQAILFLPRNPPARCSRHSVVMDVFVGGHH